MDDLLVCAQMRYFIVPIILCITYAALCGAGGNTDAHSIELLKLICWIMRSTLLYSTLLDSTILYSTLLYSILLYSLLLYSTLLYSTLFYSILYYNKVHCTHLCKRVTAMGLSLPV